MTNTIKYLGNIRLKTRDSNQDITFHNNGTKYFLSNMIASLLDVRHANSVVPQYMSLVTLNSDSSINPSELEKKLSDETLPLNKCDYLRELILSPLNIVSRYTDTKDPSCCVVSSLLTHQLADTSTYESVNDKPTYLLLLNSEQYILAYSNIAVTNFNVVFTDPNAQSTIEWQLKFSNEESKQ